jgi:hypothetical protein
MLDDWKNVPGDSNYRHWVESSSSSAGVNATLPATYERLNFAKQLFVAFQAG